MTLISYVKGVRIDVFYLPSRFVHKVLEYPVLYIWPLYNTWVKEKILKFCKVLKVSCNYICSSLYLLELPRKSIVSTDIYSFFSATMKLFLIQHYFHSIGIYFTIYARCMILSFLFTFESKRNSIMLSINLTLHSCHHERLENLTLTHSPEINIIIHLSVCFFNYYYYFMLSN